MAHHRRPLVDRRRALVMALIVLGHAAMAWMLWQSSLQHAFVHELPVADALVLSTQAPVETAPTPMPYVNVSSPIIVVVPEVLTPAFESPAAVVAAAEPEPGTAVARTEPTHSEPGLRLEIPPSAIQYLVPPPLEYPRVSRRLREAGRVIVSVFVDEKGQPRQVQIRTSSGFERLDAAAISAVQRARFKPYTENGVPTAGWALIPLDFVLDR